MKKPDSCQGCALFEKGKSFSVPEGTGSLGVMIVGEALGDHEAREGLPFRPYAPAGSVLERVIRASRLDRKQFAIWNVVACRPPNDWLEGAPWEYASIEHCRHHFKQVFDSYRPRVILALGGVALRALTGLAGKNQGVSMLRGYTFPYFREGYNIGQINNINDARRADAELAHSKEWGGPEEVAKIQAPMDVPAPDCWLVPSFHPSFIRRGASNLIGVLAHDLLKAVQLASTGRGFTKRPVQYLTRPTDSQVRDFRDYLLANPDRLVTYDIETPNSRDLPEDERDDDPSYDLISIQFSHTPETGMFLPLHAGYGAEGNYSENWALARDIMALPNPKAGHNSWNYDNPRLRFNGFTINGDNHDTMWLFHHLQPDLPMNLQFASSFFGMDFPWKHTDSSDPEFYGCADVDAPQRIMRSGLQDLQARGILESYQRYVREFNPILQRMSERGIPVNNERRLAFREELTIARGAVDVKIQGRVPEDVRKLHPKVGYVNCPDDLKPFLLPGQKRVEPVEREDICTKVYEEREEKGEGARKRVKVHYYRYRVRDFEVPAKQAKADEARVALGGLDPMTPLKLPRWCRMYDFSPNSQKQIIAYMKAMGHPIPKNLKKLDDEGNAKETTEKKELERLANKTNDDLYRWIIEWREFDKMRSTYVDGFVPHSDGRVHTMFTYAPANWQLSSKNPNVQNMPQHLELAAKFLYMMEAPAGFVWLGMDFKSFHPAMLALEAGDPDYMRLVRLDVHSYLTAHFVKVPEREKALSWDDDTLRDWLGWIKKKYAFERNYKCKRVVCGWGNGQGYKLCYQQWREYFENETESKRLFQTLDGLFPKTTACKKNMAETAHQQRFLMSRYKAIRWFWDVFHWDGSRGKLTQGEDHEKAQAFLPPNHAFGHIRDKMHGVAAQGWDEKYGMVNNVHDALYFLCPVTLEEEAIHNCRELLQEPNPILTDKLVAPGGMWVEVGIKRGRNLADTHDKDGTLWNPDGMEELKMPRPQRPLVGF